MIAASLPRWFDPRRVMTPPRSNNVVEVER